MSTGERGVTGGGDLGVGEDVLHPRLRAFQARRSGRRSEDRDASLAQLIGESVDQWRFGADHREIERVETLHRLVERQARCDLGNSRIPRRAHHAVDDRRPCESPRERVLARTAPDHQHLH